MKSSIHTPQNHTICRIPESFLYGSGHSQFSVMSYPLKGFQRRHGIRHSGVSSVLRLEIQHFSLCHGPFRAGSGGAPGLAGTAHPGSGRESRDRGRGSLDMPRGRPRALALLSVPDAGPVGQEKRRRPFWRRRCHIAGPSICPSIRCSSRAGRSGTVYSIFDRACRSALCWPLSGSGPSSRK